jgi:hypothetical protein
MDTPFYAPGTLVKVTKGAYAGKEGRVADPSQAVDARGERYPPALAGFYWVMLKSALFPVHLYQDQMEPVAVG